MLSRRQLCGPIISLLTSLFGCSSVHTASSPSSSVRVSSRKEDTRLLDDHTVVTSDIYDSVLLDISGQV